MKKIVVALLLLASPVFAQQAPQVAQQPSNVRYYIQRIASMETDIGILFEQNDKLKAEKDKAEAELKVKIEELDKLKAEKNTTSMK